MSADLELATWEGHDAEYWRHAWRAGVVRLFANVSSTNDVAVRLAESGAPDFSVAVADMQTHGRGRSGARWHAPAGSSLLVSLLFRVHDHTDTPGTAPVRVGLAVADAITAATGLAAGVKWPNDIVLPGKGKVAGILCEGALRHERGGYVVAGIGINVTQPAEAFTGELRGRACSIFSATGIEIERAAFLSSVLARLRGAAGRITAPLTSAELIQLAQRDVLLDREIICDAGNGQIMMGTARGVAENGALLVEQNGRTVHIVSGTVRLAQSHAYPGSR